MEESKHIVVYLEEIKSAYEQNFDSKNQIYEKLNHLIDYHANDPSDYFYQNFKEKNQKGSKAFSLGSVMYLIERRRIVWYQGLLHLVTKRGVLQINSEDSRKLLATEYGLTETEVTQLIATVFQLRSISTFVDGETGSEIKSKIPSNYIDTMVKFNDTMIDLKTLKLHEYKGGEIPFKVLNSNFFDVNETYVENLRELIYFIADYNREQYLKLLKILAYCYSRKRLEKMFLFLGKGRNGKGVFLNLVSRYCLGTSHSISAMSKLRKSSTTSKESEMLEILNARATLVEEELDLSKNLFDEHYKNLITGGHETGRKIAGNSVTISNKSVFYVATNKMDFSDIAHDDFSFLNRVCMTDFTNKYTLAEDNHLNVLVLDKNQGNFKTILTLVYRELKDKDIYDIPSVKSRYVKNNALGTDRQFLNIVCENMNIYKDSFEQGLLNLSKFISMSGLSKNEVKTTLDNLSEVEVIIKDNIPHYKFNRDFLMQRVFHKAKSEEFSFDILVDHEKMFELCKTKIRVTKLFWLLGLSTIDKDTLVDYVKTFDNLELTWKEEQPFVIYSPNKKEEVNQELKEPELTGIELLDSLTTPDKSLLVSVFDYKRYPYKTDLRTFVATDIPSILSPIESNKTETIKIFPYDIEYRSGKINPSRWLGLDFDESVNTTLDETLAILNSVGVKGYLQESYSSTSEKFKFHVLIECNEFVTNENYEFVAEAFEELLPFNRDKRYRYKSIMNVSSKPWIGFGKHSFNISNVESKEVFDENNTETVYDNSGIKTLGEYLAISKHETANLFAEVILNGTYKKGTRDDFVFKITSYLNDCQDRYNMNDQVYNEGYDTLIRIVEADPDLERFNFLNKINKARRVTA